MEYPKFRKENLVEEKFGHKIEDPYRYLEDDMSKESANFVRIQNDFTQAYLGKIKSREKIHEDLKKLYDYEKYSGFIVGKDRIVYRYNSGLQNQYVCYSRNGLDGKSELIIDPNTLSEDGTSAVSPVSFSNDGRYLVYLLSKAGSDWQTLKIYDFQKGRDAEDELNWIKFTDAAWEGDGFYYSSYDAPTAGSELSAVNEYMKVRYHKMGSPQSEDKLIFEDRENKYRYYSLTTTEDEKNKILSSAEGTYGSENLIFDEGKKEFVHIFKGFHAERTFIGKYDEKLLFITDEDAENMKIVAYDLATKKIEVLVPECENAINTAAIIGDMLVIGYLVDVASQLVVVNMNTKAKVKVDLPTLGNVMQIDGSKNLGGFLYSYCTSTEPMAIYFYDFAKAESTVFKKSKISFDTSEIITERHFVEASDGAKIPLFLTYKKGLKRDSNNPTLLYAYGGFNVSLPLAFDPSNAYLISQGGVYAQANIRGGNEYGESWHKAGMMHNKQRVFDDFAECAEYLINEKFCSCETLAIHGASNGGLLMGAVANQHPELYRVVFPNVGVMDMLRYHLFTVGWGWVSEYGNPDEKEHFDNIIKYSPLHNIERKAYPSVMVLTADHDDRVVPAHSFKYVAVLQEMNTSENPILIRIDARAGHGFGKSTEKVIAQASDMISFMLYEMGRID